MQQKRAMMKRSNAKVIPAGMNKKQDDDDSDSSSEKEIQEMQ